MGRGMLQRLQSHSSEWASRSDIGLTCNARDWTEQERADHLPTGATLVHRESFVRNVEEQKEPVGTSS